METKDSVLAACQSKYNNLETAIQEARLHSKCSEDLLSLAKNVLAELEMMRHDEMEVQKRLGLKFCLTVGHAADEVQKASAQKTTVEKLFSAILAPCVGGFNLNDRKVELEALAAEVRSVAKSGSRGTTPVESPLESLDSQSILSKGASKDVSEQFYDVNTPPQPRLTLVVEVDLVKNAKRLRKASRQETITAMSYVPSKTDEDWKTVSGRVWFHITRLFGTDKMVIYNLSSDVEEQADSCKAEGAITTMHVDKTGLLWSGHRSGAVIAWKEDEKKAICPGSRACSSSVRVITTDENGMVWVGSEKGDVRRLSLVPRAGSIGYELQMHRHLRHTGAGVPERSASANIDPVSQMVRNLRAKEKAHEGPVTSLAAAVGRVWTAGGSAAFVCLREWTQRGEFLKKHDLKSIGAALSMRIVSPIVRVSTSPDPASSLSSAASGSLESSMIFRNTELPQTWQLLTGHGNGIIQVWGDARGMLCPLLRIGGDASPITAVAVHAPLGLICSSHLDGRLVVQAVPHPRGQSALSVTLVDGSVSQVKLRKGEIKVADSGICGMESGPSGVVTVAYDASITFWPATALRSAAEEGGIVISEPSNLPEQWPLRAYDPQDVPAVSQSFIARPTSPAGALKFSDDASRWRIEYSDLTLARVVGEGAFGKVYLGRWHETDVAIKLLTSLSALGLPSAGEVSTNEIRESIKTLEREVALMVNMRHPNVILFMGLCPEPPCVVTEYCSRGSLYDLLKSARGDPALAQQLDWPRRLGLAMDAAKGMLYLHSHKPPIIHRDLKSPNLLVDGQWRAKVTDFNLSRLSEAPSVASSLTANNPRWQAPEVIHSRDFSTSADVYAFGLILWELATWELPFEQMTQFQIILAVGENGGRPEIPEPTSPLLRGGNFPGYDDYVSLMKSCWAQNPKDRPGFDHIIAVLRKIVIGLGNSTGQAAPRPSEETPKEVEKLPVEAVPVSNNQFVTTAPSPFEGTMLMRSPFDEAPTAAAINAPPSPFGGIAMSPFNMPAAAALPPIKVSPAEAGVPLRVIDSATDSFEGHVAGSSSTQSK